MADPWEKDHQPKEAKIPPFEEWGNCALCNKIGLFLEDIRLDGFPWKADKLAKWEAAKAELIRRLDKL